MISIPRRTVTAAEGKYDSTKMETSAECSFKKKPQKTAKNLQSPGWGSTPPVESSGVEVLCRGPAEGQDHRDSSAQACDCPPSLLSTYRASSPHHMNRHHRHPPLPPANKRCFEVALPPFVPRHGTTTEPLHGRGRLKSSLERKKGVRRENTRHSHGTIAASEGSNVLTVFAEDKTPEL